MPTSRIRAWLATLSGLVDTIIAGFQTRSLMDKILSSESFAKCSCHQTRQPIQALYGAVRPLGTHFHCMLQVQATGRVRRATGSMDQ